MTTLELFLVVLTTSFVFALKPGALTLLALKRIMTKNFFAGWIIGAGSTVGQGLQATAVVLIFSLVSEVQVVQEFSTDLQGALLNLAPYKGQLLITAGAIVAVWGWITTKGDKKEAAQINKSDFVLGLVISGLAIDYVIAYIGILTVQMEMTVTIGLSMVLAVTMGIQGAWLFKLSGILAAKKIVGSQNINFHAFTGGVLIVLGGIFSIAGINMLI